MVVGEKRIRGTVESVYQLNKEAMATEDETGNAVQMSLLSICAAFAKYFSGGKADPKKDMLLCPHCHGKTRVWLREDTILRNYLLFCPKCKQETLIDLRQFHITLLKQSDAKTQS